MSRCIVVVILTLVAGCMGYPKQFGPPSCDQILVCVTRGPCIILPEDHAARCFIGGGGGGGKQ